MHLFITGASGFIGSHCVNQALQAGHQVTALRRNAQSSPRIPLRDGAVWLERPLDELTAEDFRGIDAVIHLAAHTPNVPYDTLENCLYWNLTASLAMARAAARAGVGQFVIAGSCFEYGTSGERYESIPADAPLEPTGAYPASKAAAWIALRQFTAEAGVSASYHRIFQVFGEGEAAGRLWPSLRAAAVRGEDFPLTAGEQIRDFIPVEEVAAALLAAAQNPPAPGTLVTSNLGTGIPLSLKEFAQSWWRSWGATGNLLLGAVPYRAGEVMRYVPRLSMPNSD
jgi:nucleoside-diphosphate-sugar epimerase